MLDANPALRRLGLPDDARVLVLHADDIGMCHSTVAAYEDLLLAGIMSSAAIMPPCPWFPAAAAFCRAQSNNKQLDMGVHLTLTCEWDNYRWGPSAVSDVAAGLHDADGYFPSLAQPVADRADLAELTRELRAQVQRTLDAGIDVTHLDSHMLTLFHPRLLPIYVQVALEFQVPAFLLRDPGLMVDWTRGQAGDLASTGALLADVEAAGMPLFDHLFVLPLDAHAQRLGVARAALAECPPGVTNFLFHPASDTPELRAIAPDWRCRVADWQLFLSDEWRQTVAESGVHVVDFRTLRDCMRKG